ncbi:hypothetical protein [Paludisphaera borealis]|uniref:Uncharacterized protein n=1 Tax=Paludisphaera borealis TaxID=1387353 RepID=A0A1U7CLN5_9BACT|nr:hypothetical protein [Paludisphaera borealis]APW59850.1 hypothetical protein BSF38_01309 [Paludisphaera borealis]
MSRSVVVGTLGILMLAASLAHAQDSSPALDAPALLPPAEAAASPPASAALSAPTASEAAPRRPLLVIPGVTAPASASARTARKPSVVAGAKPSDAPALAGPATTPKAAIPLTLEPIPAADEVDEAEPKRSAPTRAKPRSTSPATPAPATGGSRYYPGAVLGRILGADDEGSNAKSAIRVESRSDPAAEAAVKRRVEQKIQEALGDHVNSVDVRVTGRTVAIRARASRFWYRRSVRRSLDTLQMPSGYRARVELID